MKKTGRLTKISCSMSNWRQCYKMNSVCHMRDGMKRTFVDSSCLCFCPTLHCGSGRDTSSAYCGSTCWTHLRFLLHFLRLSILCHGFHSYAAFMNRNPPPHDSLTNVFVTSTTVDVFLIFFQRRPLTSFFTIRCYFLFSAMMSHAMP